MMMTVTLVDNDTGDESEVEVPAHHEVCGRCEGHGTHLNPSIGEHAYSAEEFDEAFEPGSEEREHYFRRGGMYDVTCVECHGKRVVLVMDREAMRQGSAESKALLARIEEQEESQAESDAAYEAECRMEQMMGC